MSQKNRSKTEKPPASPSRPRFTDRRLRFELLVATIVMMVGVAVLYPEIVFQDHVFFGGDSQAAASFATVGREAMDRGVYPVWNPYLFSGMPSFGSLSYTPDVYPVSYLIEVLKKVLFLPRYTWLFFHTWLMGMAVYLLLRQRRVHWAAAMGSGVLMMWMPNLVAVGAHGHGSQAVASAYLPLALLLWDRIWRGKSALANGCGLALVLGFSMLRGHLQISYYTYLFVGLHFLFFGGARLIDGLKGRVPDAALVPKRWFQKLTGGGKRYSAGAATAEVGWAAAVLALVVVASLMMSTSLYAPVQDYAQYSIRGSSGSGGLDYGYATSWSLHPVESLTFVIPYALGFGKDLYYGWMPFTDYPNYFGVVLFLMAIAALILVKTRFVRFLAFTVVVTTLVAFGKFLPVLYDPMFKLMPYFNKFRVPVMILIVQQVAMVILFGIGLDAVLRADGSRGRRFAVQGLAGAFLVFMIVVLSQGYWGGDFASSISSRIRGAATADQQLMVAKAAGTYLRNDLMRFAIVLAGVFVVLFLYFNYRRMPAAAAAILLVLLGLVDFYVIDKNILHPEQWRRYDVYKIIHPRSETEKYKQPDELITFLKTLEGPYRVFPMDSPRQPFSSLFHSNRFMNFGVASIGGYHAAKLASYDEFLRTALPASLRSGRFGLVDMLNTRYWVTAVELPEHPRFVPLWSGVDYQGQPRFVYESTGAFPRAYAVDSYRVAEGEAALRALGNGDVDVSTSVVLDRKPVVEPVSAEGAQLEVTSHDFNEVRMRASGDEPFLAVLSEVYYPDWKATVDGQPVEVMRANHVLRAVALPAGDHEVVFTYDWSLIRRSFMLSRATILAALLVLLVYFVFWIRSSKRGSAHLRTDIQ